LVKSTVIRHATFVKATGAVSGASEVGRYQNLKGRKANDFVWFFIRDWTIRPWKPNFLKITRIHEALCLETEGFLFFSMCPLAGGLRI